MPLPQFVNRSLCQLGDAVNVPKVEPGHGAKMILDRSHTLLEPDSRDCIPVAVHGSDAYGDNRLLLVVWQLVVIERDDNKSHILLRRNETSGFSRSEASRSHFRAGSSIQAIHGPAGGLLKTERLRKPKTSASRRPGKGFST